ncbi:MAG: hypothetical protein Q4G62_05430, partial [Pseudomonadota bacterium]|nr:hypothetical protein [Pseudomonadota bacterium]
MTDLTPESQQIIQRFSSRADVSQIHADNLLALLKDSPALASQFNDAVAAGHLTEITPLTNPHAGGEYNPQTKVISLPLSQLEADPNGVFNPSEITFVLGHELQHGLNQDERTQAHQEFLNAIDAKAQESGTPRDYTDASVALISADRRDEAGAQIAGWNAVLSMVKTTHPAPSLEQIYDAHPSRMEDFIDRDISKTPYTYNLKGNLTLNDDLSMPFSEGNLEGMGVNYFDKSPADVRLGHNGNSDYPNYYGAWIISTIELYERHYNPVPANGETPPIALDMQKLGFQERLLEENGLHLSQPAHPLRYLDIGVTPPTQGLFQHTHGSYSHVFPISGQPYGGLAGEAPNASGPLPLQPHDQALLEQIRTGVAKLDAEHGRNPDDTSERISHSLLVTARRGGLERADHVFLSEDASRIFVMQGQPNDFTRLHASLPTTDAASTSIDQSRQQLQEVEQQ